MTARAKIAIGALLTTVGLGASLGLPTAAASDAHTSAVSVAIDALTANDAVLAAGRVPTGFRTMFYEPAVENGVLVNPTGECSSPIPLPREFDTACKAHDLGYDLIRYGAATGDPAATRLREDLDASLRTSLHDSCRVRDGIGSRSVCYLMSDVASAAVEFNSWRQGYGNPGPEPALPFLLAGTLVAAGAAAASTAAAVVARRAKAHA